MAEPLPDRRTVLTGVLAGGVALPLLSACGSTGAMATNTAGSNGGSGGSGGGAKGRAGAKLAPTSEIPVGGGKIFSAQNVVVTQPTKGTFKGFSGTCTHAGCPVGSISSGEIICPCHGSAFAITDGSVRNGPATQPLPAVAIKVSGSEISLG